MHRASHKDSIELTRYQPCTRHINRVNAPIAVAANRCHPSPIRLKEDWRDCFICSHIYAAALWAQYAMLVVGWCAYARACVHRWRTEANVVIAVGSIYKQRVGRVPQCLRLRSHTPSSDTQPACAERGPRRSVRAYQNSMAAATTMSSHSSGSGTPVAANGLVGTVSPTCSYSRWKRSP